MSALSQNPPSDQLSKLRLFLEKKKTEFISENHDLIEWMQDRNFHVDQLSFSIEKNEQPQSPQNSVESELLQDIAVLNTDPNLASEITLEEYQSIRQKMIELLQLPAGQLEENSELYLEQQLSDILGFDILGNIDGQRLIYSTGIMQGQPHLKRFPTDTLENHDSFSEAGIASIRSAFGWFSNSENISDEAVAAEKYYVSLPLYYLENWNTQYSELKKWYKFRKVVVINPVEEIAVVAAIGNIGPSTITRRQFGGSPELIHSGKIWSPGSAGKVILFFVNDPSNEVPLGPVHYGSVFVQKIKSE